MPDSDIVSPTGLDLSPKPPNAVRVSKRAGFLFLLVGGLVAAAILYGIATRGKRQFRLGFDPEGAKGMTAATDAGKVIAAQIPARPTGQSPEVQHRENQELQPPAPRPSRPVARQPRSARPAQAVAPAPAQYRDPTPEERRRALAFERELQALDAPTAARAGFMGGRESSLPTPQGDVAQMTELLRAMKGPGGLSSSGTSVAAGAVARPFVLDGGSASQAEEYRLQNAQDEKEAFLDKARSRKGETYLGTTRVKPLGKYEIKAGWDIPAILEQALNSDLPGEIKALVRENVYDTATGKHLLIPQGSRVVGIYDSRVAYGQDGVQVVWNRIIFPDGSSINLEGMSGQDAKGYTGLRYDVDNHYRRLVGFAVLTSVFSAAFQLSQSRRGTVFSYPSPAETAGSAVGREVSQIGAEVTRRNLNVQPTIKVPVGYRFNIRVNRDLLFEAPYTSG
jgi:type IV secretion system protein VirB10